MNLNELIKTLTALQQLQTSAVETSESIHAPFIGKYVIVRTHDAGVHAGILAASNGRECVLHEARRLWQWKPAAGMWLDGVANSGLHTESRISEPVAERLLTEDCEITVCTPQAEQSIRNIPAAKPHD